MHPREEFLKHAAECHLSAMRFQVSLSTGLRANLAMSSHSAASKMHFGVFQNSSRGASGRYSL